MSRCCEIVISVSEFNTNRYLRIIDAVHGLSYDADYVLSDKLVEQYVCSKKNDPRNSIQFCPVTTNVCWGSNNESIARKIVEAIWEANDAFCIVRVVVRDLVLTVPVYSWDRASFDKSTPVDDAALISLDTINVFQLPTGTQSQITRNVFSKFGLEKNPFSIAGTDSEVFYANHMIEEIGRVNEWIDEVVRSERAFRPLAISGSLGAGRTHLLRTMRRGLQETQSHVLFHEFSGEKTLANMIFKCAPISHLLLEIVKALRNSDFVLDDAIIADSLLRAPLQILQQSSDNDQNRQRVLLLSNWMQRKPTTPTQRAELDLTFDSRILMNEGQAIRVICDLFRLTKAANIIQVWFIMIDQLEEIWREGAIIPTRRSRFFTDMRFLLDQALGGAPIAVLLAWNNTTNTSKHMQRDYPALWQRFCNPVSLPLLQKSDIWPFAEAYLDRIGVTKDALNEKKNDLYIRLRQQINTVLKSLGKRDHEGGFSPRQVLHEWREMANSIAKR